MARFIPFLIFLAALVGYVEFAHAEQTLVDRAIAANVQINDGIHACSGYVIDKARHLVATAAHCIEGAVTNLKVNGKRVPIIDVDMTHDVAILHVPSATFPVEVPMAVPVLKPGTPVFSVSNPLEEENWVGFGVISRLVDPTSYPGVKRIFKYNAIGINMVGTCEGSSGGAVYDGMGTVIGTITAGDGTCGPLMVMSPATWTIKLLETIHAAS